MKLYDENVEKTYSMQELKAEYIDCKKEDPLNHCATFTIELYEIILATINGRNDCTISGYTGKELSGIVKRIKNKIN